MPRAGEGERHRQPELEGHVEARHARRTRGELHPRQVVHRRGALADQPEEPLQAVAVGGDLEDAAGRETEPGEARDQGEEVVGVVGVEGAVDEDVGPRGSAGSGASALGAPLVTNIQLTRACNLTCDHCFVDVETKPHPRELSLAQLEGLFAELSGAGAKGVLPIVREDGTWRALTATEVALKGKPTENVLNKILEPQIGAVLGKILILALIILFIQKRPQGLFALKGRVID